MTDESANKTLQVREKSSAFKQRLNFEATSMPLSSRERLRIDRLHFLTGCHKNQVLYDLCLSMFFIVLLFIGAPLYVLLVFVGMYSVVFVVMAKLSVLAK